MVSPDSGGWLRVPDPGDACYGKIGQVEKHEDVWWKSKKEEIDVLVSFS